MATPNELEQQRQREAAVTKQKSETAGKNTIDTNEIQKGTPDDLKAKGSSKLPFILYTIGGQVKSIIQPSLDNLTKQYVEKYQSQGVCLTPLELSELRQQRDLIVEQLNNIGIKIDRIGTSITGISSFLTTIITLITTLDIASIAASLALKIPPVNALPVPGSIVSLIGDAQTLIRKTTFDQLGNSKLAKLQTALGGAALVISIVSSYILKAVDNLKLIDAILKECDPNNSLIPLNPEINILASTQQQASQTENETSYNGFIIDHQILKKLLKRQ